MTDPSPVGIVDQEKSSVAGRNQEMTPNLSLSADPVDATLQEVAELQKQQIDHVEEADDDPKAAGEQQPPTSAFRDMPRKQAARLFWKTVLFAVCAAWAAIMDGFLITIPGSIVANKYFIEQFATVFTNGTPALDARYVGAFTGVQSVGQILGMIGGPMTSDRFGRRFNLFLVSVLLSIGVICEMVAKSDPVWLVARLFAGWGTGMAQSTIPVYISEIAPPQLRGALTATYNFWFGVGQFAGAIALQIQTGLVGYKQSIYCQWLFIGLMVPVFLVVPESPWFYINRNEPEKAKKSLLRLNGNIDGYDVEREFSVLNYEREQMNRIHQMSATAGYKEIFTGTNGRRTWISWLPLQFQGLGGLSFILSYTTYFFQLAGVSNPFLGNVIIKCIQLSAQVVSWYNIERFGRRKLLLIGGFFMGLVNLIVGILGTVNIEKIPSGVVVALFAIWTWSYASSCAPLGYTYLAETSTPRLRAKTAGFAAACTACVGIVTNFCTPLLLSDQDAGWSYKTGYLFFGTSLLGWIGIFFTVPEVANRDYEELDELFERKVATRKFAETKTRKQLEKEDGTNELSA